MPFSCTKIKTDPIKNTSFMRCFLLKAHQQADELKLSYEHEDLRLTHNSMTLCINDRLSILFGECTELW